MKSDLKLSAGSNAFYPGKPGMFVCEDFSATLANGRVIKIPEGFWYNGASVPPLFWQITFTPFDPRIIEAACIHDWLYTARCVERSIADQTLFAYLNRNGGGWLRPKLVRAAVRVCGSFAWRESVTDKNYRAVLKAQLISDGKDLALYGL